MDKTFVSWKYGKLTYGLVLLLWVVYVTSLFLAKSDNQFHLGWVVTNVIRVSFALPILLVWWGAALAAVRFKAYASLIAGSREAAGFLRIASGLYFLLGYLVTLLVMGRVATLFSGSSFISLIVFVKNHLPAYLFAISLIQIYRGAAHLADSAKAKPTRRQLLVVFLGYLTFSTLFVALFFGTSAGTQALVGGIPAFSVPHSALLFTLVLPSLLSWFVGILANVLLRAYAKRVKGIIYQACLKLLVIGIYATTLFAILVQLLVLDSSRLQHLGLNAVLLIVYGFIAAYGVGAVFIARSAAKLTLIEVSA